MGHWGRHGAAPRSTTPAAVAGGCGLDDTPIPLTAECGCCGTVAVLAGKQLPGGWVISSGEAICGDCTPRPARAPSAGRVQHVVPAGRLAAIGATDSPHRGCRIGHELALGFAAIQIRAGARAPDGRDERVQFMLDAHAIDELIIALSGIRDELIGKKH